jgi:hypothetical protein
MGLTLFGSGSKFGFDFYRFPKLLDCRIDGGDGRVDGGEKLQLFATACLTPISESASV